MGFVSTQLWAFRDTATRPLRGGWGASEKWQFLSSRCLSKLCPLTVHTCLVCVVGHSPPENVQLFLPSEDGEHKIEALIPKKNTQSRSPVRSVKMSSRPSFSQRRLSEKIKASVARREGSGETSPQRGTRQRRASR